MVWSLHSAKVKAELSAQQDVNSSVWSQEEARSRLASEQDFNRGTPDGRAPQVFMWLELCLPQADLLWELNPATESFGWQQVLNFQM